MKFVWKAGQGITKFAIVGKDGTYPVAEGDEPLKLTLVLDPPVATTGQCCEAYFVASPLPDGRSHLPDWASLSRSKAAGSNLTRR
jgi:hypothetical protein